MPGKYNMTIWRGNDFDLAFALKDGAGDAVDLTNLEVVFRAAWSSSSMRYSTEDTPGDSHIVVSDATAGIVSLHIEPLETRIFPEEEPIDYEIEVRSTTEETTVLYGKIGVIGGMNDDA